MVEESKPSSKLSTCRRTEKTSGSFKPDDNAPEGTIDKLKINCFEMSTISTLFSLIVDEFTTFPVKLSFPNSSIF